MTEDAESSQWMVQAGPGEPVTLVYSRLPIGYYIPNFKPPRTLRCPTCGRVAVRSQHHYLHESVIELDTRNNPKARETVWCRVPPPLTQEMRAVLVSLRDGLEPDKPSKETMSALEHRGLIVKVGLFSRVKPAERITEAGKRLLEEGW